MRCLTHVAQRATAPRPFWPSRLRSAPWRDERSDESTPPAGPAGGAHGLFADFVRETEASLDLDEGLREVCPGNLFERLTNALTEGIDIDAGLAEVRARAVANRRREGERSE
ncbi:MAG: hypothetical protein ACRDRK_18820 [Pseudonocardia sp.]